jgi:hypothetical protein
MKKLVNLTKTLNSLRLNGNKAAEKTRKIHPNNEGLKQFQLYNFTYNSWLSNLLENPTKKAEPQG